MSNFPAWFNRAYKRWSRSQAGEEDFIAFCDLLGYPPFKVLGWMHGEFLPEAEALCPVFEVAAGGLHQFVPKLAQLIQSWQPSHIVTAFADTHSMPYRIVILPLSLPQRPLF